MKTILAPITVFYRGEYVPPGTSIELPDVEAAALDARFGPYAPKPPDAATIARLNSTAIAFGGSAAPADTVAQRLAALEAAIVTKATPADLAALVASAPATLDTLKELAAALGNDPNFATTIAGTIGALQQALNAANTAISGKASAAAFQSLSEAVAAIPPSSFLSSNYTLATLPPPADNPWKYARVTDLFDNQPDVVISNGSVWKPVRPLAARTVTNGNADMTLSAMVNAPTQIIQGALSVARNMTLTKNYAYSGARFRVKREATGLVGLIVKTVSGSGLGSLGLSSWADFEYDGTEWKQTASGGLL